MMKYTRNRFFLLLLLCVLGLTACQKPKTAGEAEKASYVSITQEEAKKVMDEEENRIILDVRTQAEYEEGHIEGAILIPHDEISGRAEHELTDKNQTILVYCRSGNRSKQASRSLAELGYTDVREFGGISTWEYGTVTE